MSDRSGLPHAQAARAYAAAAIRVASGANLGDPIALAEQVELGDIYRVDREARPFLLMLAPVAGERQAQSLAEGSEIGQTGDRVSLLSELTLMAPDGDLVEVLVARHDRSGQILAIPLSPIAVRLDYTLIEASSDVRDLRIADIICASFAAGTMITVPGGAQRAIETFAPGDVVLTRDHGPQEIQWIGKATLRAKGAFAPVVISARTLNNDTDLVVSPHHRVFIYQRGPERLGETAELLVQAKHLVDGDAVTRREGGFVNYFSLVFRQHEIIYAEGVPAESLLVNETTVQLLPAELAEEVKARFPGLNQSQHFGTEAGEDLMNDSARRTLFNRPGRS